MEVPNRELKERLQGLKRAFASSALEGLDNPKINQYLVDQVLRGLTFEESISEINQELQTNCDEFLAKFD